MARVGSAVCGILPLLVVVTAMAASDLFDNQLGDISYCKNQCQITIRNKKAAKLDVDLMCIPHLERSVAHAGLRRERTERHLFMDGGSGKS
ncbi:hypothetical protein Baya_7851 [Bagarius yarrelli]|uniref:Uncharacterized protein n=1 Tax=Bagarius yarrelli TaxID=175774 RepID=A0A556U315_BAGYA|nr:hypothetical protein Baya_7851 [Bagarius yarrelli]